MTAYIQLTNKDQRDFAVPILAIQRVEESASGSLVTLAGQSVEVIESVSTIIAAIEAADLMALNAQAGIPPDTTTTKFTNLFDHYASVGNSGTSETDLYSDTTVASQLASNGEKLAANYAGSFVSSATATRQVKLYFAGTAILDTGALSTATAETWKLEVLLIRVSATVVRYAVEFAATTAAGAGLFSEVSCGELTGLTLSNTNILKITGTAAGVGAATNDIVAKLGSVAWLAAA